MKLYRIEKGVKIPPVSHPPQSGKSSPIAATMQALEKGESFFIKDPVVAQNASKVMRDFTRRERRAQRTREFVSRKVGSGIRIWRVK